MILVPQNAKIPHNIAIMIIRWPAPIPFTSKDRVAYQINGKTTMSREKKMNKKDILVGRMLLVTCSISKQKHPCYFFQNKHQHFQNTFKTSSKLGIFSKAQHFVYVLTNENYYKVCLNDDVFFKILSKTTQITFSNKSKWYIKQLRAHI